MCITESGPQQRGWVAESVLEELLVQAGTTDEVVAVSLSGGEPFSRFSDLKRITATLHSAGVHVGITTSAHWANNRDVVTSRLAALSETGQISLTVSTDLFHQEFTPEDRPRLLALVAQELGIPISVNWVIRGDECERRLTAWYSNQGIDVVASHFVPLGRASGLTIEPRRVASATLSGPCGIATNSLTIDSDGTAYGCCGLLIPEQIIGKFPSDSLSSLLRRVDESLLFRAMNEIGPLGVAGILGMDVNGARSQCEVCLRLTRGSSDDSRIGEAQLLSLDFALAYLQGRREHAHRTDSDAASQ